jgi:hypothetical protein
MLLLLLLAEMLVMQSSHYISSIIFCEELNCEIAFQKMYFSCCLYYQCGKIVYKIIGPVKLNLKSPSCCVPFFLTEQKGCL